MKDNKRMNNNQGRNNNHRNVTTFVEDLGGIIRRNSTIPQAISGELRITNGDVEGAVGKYWLLDFLQHFVHLFPVFVSCEC